MFSKLNTLFNTLIHLKPTQVIYQVKNRLSKVDPLSSFHLPIPQTQKLDFFQAPAVNTFLRVKSDQFHFEFLNLSQTYSKSSIDWNDQSHGKLWNYNLQYLDFLKQEDVPLEIKIDILRDIYSWLWGGKLPLEPYPASLRIMNLIRFLNQNELPFDDEKFLKSYLISEINYLSKNLEFHLLANHLLENAFAFWMGALYFQNENWQQKAGKLLREQLEEQILPDGAHYELAPMYHQIILFRVLEAYQLTPSNYVLKFILKEKAELMLGWLKQITFSNGGVPKFNDTTEDVAYDSAFLQNIGKSLSLYPKTKAIKESGYRILQTDKLQLIADVEGIKPSYQPGHAHADTFSFVLHANEKPLIVDPGISTYAIGSRRDWERSSLAHNTVTIDRKNSSQVWAGFRVGKRAKIKLLKDEQNLIVASHDGFGRQKHQRTFHLFENSLQVKDQIINPKANSLFEARFYFHPDIKPHLSENGIITLTNHFLMEVNGAEELILEEYDYCVGYNKFQAATYLLIVFKKNSITSLISPKS